MNAEHRGPAQDTRNNAGRRGRIAFARSGDAEDASNRALSRNRKKDWTLKFAKGFEFAVDPQAIRSLLRKIDSWVQDDCVSGDTRPFGKGNLLPKKPQLAR